MSKHYKKYQKKSSIYRYSDTHQNRLIVVIRNIPLDIPAEYIQQELFDLGFKPLKILRACHKLNNYPMPLHFVHLEQTEKSLQIFNLEKLCHTIIKVERFRSKYSDVHEQPIEYTKNEAKRELSPTVNETKMESNPKVNETKKELNPKVNETLNKDKSIESDKVSAFSRPTYSSVLKDTKCETKTTEKEDKKEIEDYPKDKKKIEDYPPLPEPIVKLPLPLGPVQSGIKPFHKQISSSLQERLDLNEPQKADENINQDKESYTIDKLPSGLGYKSAETDPPGTTGCAGPKDELEKTNEENKEQFKEYSLWTHKLIVPLDTVFPHSEKIFGNKFVCSTEGDVAGASGVGGYECSPENTDRAGNEDFTPWPDRVLRKLPGDNNLFVDITPPRPDSDLDTQSQTEDLFSRELENRDSQTIVILPIGSGNKSMNRTEGDVAGASGVGGYKGSLENTDRAVIEVYSPRPGRATMTQELGALFPREVIATPRRSFLLNTQPQTEDLFNRELENRGSQKIAILPIGSGNKSMNSNKSDVAGTSGVGGYKGSLENTDGAGNEVYSPRPGRATGRMSDGPLHREVIATPRQSFALNTQPQTDDLFNRDLENRDFHTIENLLIGSGNESMNSTEGNVAGASGVGGYKGLLENIDGAGNDYYSPWPGRATMTQVPCPSFDREFIVNPRPSFPLNTQPQTEELFNLGGGEREVDLSRGPNQYIQRMMEPALRSIIINSFFQDEDGLEELDRFIQGYYAE